MAAKPARSDEDNLRLLDQLRPAFDKLRTERIRAEGEIERLSRELEEARAEALAEFGTADEAAVREMIEAARAENSEAVDRFAERVRAVGARLADLARRS